MQLAVAGAVQVMERTQVTTPLWVWGAMVVLFIVIVILLFICFMQARQRKSAQQGRDASQAL